MKAPRKVTVRFRKTVFDCYVYDGLVESTYYNKMPVDGLFFDMGFNADIQTLASEAIAQQDIEIAEQLKESEN